MSLRLNSETAPDGSLEESDPHEQIARLEAHIDDLAEAMDRCRKIILASKVAIAGGGIWMLAVVLGVVGFDPLAMVAAIAAVIGGTVLFGSNTATAKEISAAVKAAEARRAELIAGLELRVVGDGVPEEE
jgi:predicted transcriptional regulator